MALSSRRPRAYHCLASAVSAHWINSQKAFATMTAAALAVDPATIAPPSNDKQEKIDKLSAILLRVAAGNPAHTIFAKAATSIDDDDFKKLAGHAGVVFEDRPSFIALYQLAIDKTREAVGGVAPANDEKALEEAMQKAAGEPETAAAPKKRKKAEKPEQAPTADATATETPAAPKKRKKAEATADGAEAPAAEPVDAPIVPFEAFKVDPAVVTLSQERTKKIPLPEAFFFEADPATVGTKSKGHQVDPSRGEGFSPVMPNVTLLAGSKNPYPPKADDTVVTAERYKPLVAVSHAVWEILQAYGEMRSNPDKKIMAEILDHAGVSEDRASRACVRDTLRDLALYGLVDHFTQGRARIFKVKA